MTTESTAHAAPTGPAYLPEIAELASAVAAQAQALADGKIPTAQLFAHIARLHNNTDTLKAWAGDMRP